MIVETAEKLVKGMFDDVEFAPIDTKTMNRVCKVRYCGNQTLFGNMICTECERYAESKIVEVAA